MSIDRSTYAATASSMLSIVITWAWNSFVPNHPLPPDVAAAMGGIIAAIVSQIVPDTTLENWQLNAPRP